MILVTGATGFIGSHLMCHLAKKDIYPVALFRHASNQKVVRALFESTFSGDAHERFQKIIWRQGDLRDFSSLLAAFEGITSVYHCAGYISMAQGDIAKLNEINIQGSTFLVNLCLEKAVKKLVYVSSIAALGSDPTTDRIDEYTAWDNTTDKTPYAYSKYGGEIEVWRAMQEGLNAVIVNPGIVLGKDSPFDTVIQRFEKGFRGYTPGSSGFVSIADVIEVLEHLMNSTIRDERFILVAENWTGKAVARFILNNNGKSSRVFKIPKSFFYLFWILEYALMLLRIKKRFLTLALISSLYEQKSIDGSKIKTVIPFEYRPIGKLLSTSAV